MSRVNDLSLVVYLATINRKKLEDVMVKWSGCDKECYVEPVLVDLYQNALSDITNVYHIPNMFYHYFDARKTQKALQYLGDKYKYTEIDVVTSPFQWIPVKIWDVEDTKRLIALRKKYIGEDTE